MVGGGRQSGFASPYKPDCLDLSLPCSNHGIGSMGDMEILLQLPAIYCQLRHAEGHLVITWQSGMGRAENNMRQGFAIQRAHRTERVKRALSIAIPVLAYIWR